MPIGISVVVPSFNQGEFITDTLECLLGQQYPALEVIVQDGGSTDGTVNILKGYGNRIQWTSGKDGGQGDAIRQGFQKARHEWITWLNSDDVQCDRALWRVNEALEREPRADLVVGNGHYMGRNGEYLRPYPRINLAPGINIADEMFEKGYLAQPSVFFRKSKYRKIGGINTSLKICLDYDLWCRFALHGCRFVGIEADISGNRWYPQTKTSSQPFDLLAEACATQFRLFHKVSPYFVQAVSDTLYQLLHANQFGTEQSLFFRNVFFKALWACLNVRNEDWWYHGLAEQNLARTSPLVADYIGNEEWLREAATVLDLPRAKSFIAALLHPEARPPR